MKVMDEDIRENVVEETNENTEAQTVEQIEEGIELTDTAEVEENEEIAETTEETKEARKTLMELLEDADYEKEFNTIFDDKFDKKYARIKREHEKELAKYKNTETILNKGLGTQNIDEANKTMINSFREQGIEMPELSIGLSDRDVEILAKADADEIIEAGITEMTNEANKLASKGYDNLTQKEKVIFNTLPESLTIENRHTELKKIGVNPSILEDKGFKAFMEQFNSKTPITEIHKLYSKLNNAKKEIEPIGSMKTDNSKPTIKDFYTYEESLKFTKNDYDRNPALFKVIEESMTKW